MKDKNKTTDQLMNELVELRQRIAELEAADTERKRAEEALRESEKKYRQLVKYAPTGIYEVDLTTSRFTSVNDVMCEYAGYTREEFLSLSPVDLATEDYRERVLERQAKILAGEQIPETVEYKVRGKSGREFWVILNTRLVYEDGKPVRATVVAHDITERKRAEEALRAEKEFSENMLNALVDTVFVFDPNTGTPLRWNKAFNEISGCTDEEIASKKTPDDWYSEEDLKRAEVATEKVLQEGRAIAEMSLVTKDGKLIPTEYTGSLIRDAEGRPQYVIAVGRDITERKRAEEALRESEERFRQFFENEPEYCYMISPEGVILDVNSAALEALGYKKEELVGKPLKTIYAPESLPRLKQLFAKWKETGELKDEEMVIITKEKDRRVVLLSAGVVKDSSGKVLHSVSVQRDITERKRAEEQLAHMATHDALTDLPNRTLFNDRLTLALAHAQRNQQMLAVMLLDLDHFKDVNDMLGHSVGDKLLQIAGDRLASLLRKSDTVARMGGDEFMLLLPEATQEEAAAKIAAKILETFREPFAFDDHELYITTSIGIAIYPNDGGDADALMRNADIAMYRAKDRGRDNYQRYASAMKVKALE